MDMATPRHAERTPGHAVSGEASEPLAMIPERIVSLARPELREWTIDRIYSDPASALTTLEPLLEHFPGADDRAVIDFALATALAVTGELARAESLLQRTLDHYRERHDGLSAAHVLLRWNLVWHQRGEFEHAIEELTMVVEIAREHRDHWLECATLSDISMLQMIKGSVADGIVNMFECLAIADRGDNTTLRSIVRMNLGFALFDLHDYAAAAATIQEVLADPPEVRRLPVLFEGHSLLAACLEQSGDFDRALEHLTLARQYAAELVFPYGLAESAYDEGRLFYRLGQFDDAAASFRHAIDGYRALESPNRAVRLAVAEWWCERIEQRFTQPTLDRLVQAAGDAPTDAFNRTFDLHDAIAQSAVALGNFELAVTHLQESRRLVEAYWSDLGDRQARVAHRRFQVDTAQQTAERERALRQHLAVTLAASEELNRTNQALLKQLRAQSATLERQAIEDPLTQIGNRRLFVDQLEHERARSREFNHPVTVALADIDNFKEVNDAHSHRIGDVVLRDIAHLLAENIREIDTVARYGGEEFAFILPEADEAIATRQLEQVRSAVEGYALNVSGREIHVTISIGVVRHDASAPIEEVMSRADELLYRAKHSGKNQVRFGDYTGREAIPNR